jgi:hypothetical protein
MAKKNSCKQSKNTSRCKNNHVKMSTLGNTDFLNSFLQLLTAVILMDMTGSNTLLENGALSHKYMS